MQTTTFEKHLEENATAASIRLGVDDFVALNLEGQKAWDRRRVAA
jgi:hypothetical protein